MQLSTHSQIVDNGQTSWIVSAQLHSACDLQLIVCVDSGPSGFGGSDQLAKVRSECSSWLIGRNPSDEQAAISLSS
jgi:hypothetical protein